MVRPGKKSEKPDSLVKQILKKDRELDPKPGPSEKPKVGNRLEYVDSVVAGCCIKISLCSD